LGTALTLTLVRLRFGILGEAERGAKPRADRIIVGNVSRSREYLILTLFATRFAHRRFAIISTFLVLGYSVLYQVVYQSWRISKKSGWTRTWPNGPTLFNKRMRVFDQGYRIWTDEKWGEVHGKKFMGEGVREPGETW